ncbi:hypothetical protein J6590_098632 [Homalodisca vitripennis]|nr:hypothetical protein J6590_098632 [Homalodisca vitripennis]
MLDSMSDVMVTECKVAVKQDSEYFNMITQCHKLNIKNDPHTYVHQCLYHIVGLREVFYNFSHQKAITYEASFSIRREKKERKKERKKHFFIEAKLGPHGPFLHLTS